MAIAGQVELSLDNMTGIAVHLELSVENMTEILCGQKLVLFNCKFNSF